MPEPGGAGIAPVMGYEVVMSGDNTGDRTDRDLEEMKSEHERMFQTVDKIKDAIGADDIYVAKHLMIQLQIYQQSHFEHEDKLMEQYEYPQIADHKAIHDNLNEALHNLNRLISLENLQRLNGELVTYLENSLTHVIEVDRPFQEFLSKSTERDG
jgi:hemerythrin